MINRLSGREKKHCSMNPLWVAASGEIQSVTWQNGEPIGGDDQRGLTRNIRFRKKCWCCDARWSCCRATREFWPSAWSPCTVPGGETTKYIPRRLLSSGTSVSCNRRDKPLMSSLTNCWSSCRNNESRGGSVHQQELRALRTDTPRRAHRHTERNKAGSQRERVYKSIKFYIWNK